MRSLRPFPYYTANTTGMLKVIGIASGTALPAGTIYHHGHAYHPNGSMYVVFA